ncbi:MAG: Asp23/Gls24 family envelope stress response protein [Clostridiaceae bacterium]|nr:Asp23/Gls24 family envelope stress response protein [Clostridiaceae bacterium]
MKTAIRFDKHRKIEHESAEEHLRDHLDGTAGRKVEKTEKIDRTGPFKPFGKLAEAVNRSYSERNAVAVEKIRDDARDVLVQIAVIAFVGPSGTGKSTRAISVARQYQIAYLIDDGLLIHGTQIVAGTSAKKASSKLESVRQALFADETRAAVMRRALVAHHPATLMILGTSDGMLAKICQNLWLNPPSMLIRIEDVSTDEEMRQAKQTRMSEGKHTIPVPSMEIKHEFSGYFADPLSRLRRRRDRDRSPIPAPDSERTVVRPTFSSLGGYSISDEAMRMMVEIILRRIHGVAGLVRFQAENEIYGVVIDLELALYYGFSAQQVLQAVQERVSSQIEEYTAINVVAVNVKAKRVVYAQTAPPAANGDHRSSS